jgi:hypothetical protein
VPGNQLAQGPLLNQVTTASEEEPQGVDVASEWPTTRKLARPVNTSAFVGTNQTDELITSEFAVTQDLTASGWRLDSLLRNTDSRARSHSLQSRCLHRPNRQ